MNSIVGIIAEYNPFHNGHAYQLREAKRLARAEYCVAVMSGPMTQRGEPAILSKFDRAEAACAAGADLVIEMPVSNALSSAEGFAAGGIGMLTALGADTVSFGTECDELSRLSRAAVLLYDEPPAFSERVRAMLADGLSHPAAVRKALEETDPGLAPLLMRSNSILAVEYLKAIRRFDACLTPVPVLRQGDYNDAALPSDGFASASAIRKAFRGGDPGWEDAVPSATRRQLAEGPVLPEDAYSLAVRLALRRLSPDEADSLPGAEEGLGRRLLRLAETNASCEDLVSAAATRRYSEARVRRVLAAAVLGLTKADLTNAMRLPPYAHVLAMGPRGREVLGLLHRRASIPLVIRPEDLPGDPFSLRTAQLEALAQDLWFTLSGGPWYTDRTRRLTPISDMRL